MIHSGAKISVKKPGNGRASYSIVFQNPGEKWAAYQSEGLKQINIQFKNGTLTAYKAEAAVKTIVSLLYKERDKGQDRATMSEENNKLLGRYLIERYTPTRRARMEANSYRAHVNFLKQALTYLTMTPISTEVRIIQQVIDQALNDNYRKHARMVSVLNSMLNWLGRTERLLPFKHTSWEITYLTEKELALVLPCLDSEIGRVACGLAFWTGLRLGELCAITNADMRGDFLMVRTQIGNKLNRRETKTRKGRRVLLQTQAIKWLEKWLEIPESERHRFRLQKPSGKLKAASMKALGRDNITFHSLRHSRAIYMISRGVSIELVAQNIGNTPQVCEKHYYGHMLSDQGAEYMKQILNQ